MDEIMRLFLENQVIKTMMWTSEHQASKIFIEGARPPIRFFRKVRCQIVTTYLINGWILLDHDRKKLKVHVCNIR